MTPDWQLPPGTDRGLWDYVQSDRVAREYDAALAGSPLLAADVAFCERHFTEPGRLVDLGCGTGRLLLHFAKRGWDVTGVDLSPTMLEVARQAAERDALNVSLLEANLVELDMVADASFDAAACLFSTLGMVRGRANRQRFLGHVRRILKATGRFVVHVHNAKFRGVGGSRGTEQGDRTMPQARGGADLTIHHFTRGESVRDLVEAGFRIVEMLPVGVDGPMSKPWLLPRWRAYGYLIAAAPHLTDESHMRA